MILKTYPQNGMNEDELRDAELFCEAVGGFLEKPVLTDDGTWRAVLRFWQQPLLAEQLAEADERLAQEFAIRSTA